MPFFWENMKWRERLHELGIKIPEASRYIIDEYIQFDNGWTRRPRDGMQPTEPESDSTIEQRLNTDCKDAFISPLFEMLNLSAGDSIAENLLTTTGIGRVHITEEVDFQQKCIEQFLTVIASRMGEIDPRLFFRIAGIGSMAEQCKVGYADEYDYRLDIEIEELSQYITNDFNLESLRKEINKGALRFIRKFYALFEKLLRGLKSDKTQKPLTFLCHGYNNSGVLFLLFRWSDGMLIKVDCVPSIVAIGIWPSERKTDPLGRGIPKLSHIILTRESHNDSLKLSWSVCAAEVDFTSRLPSHIKDAYALTKIIWAGTVLDSSDFLSTCITINKPTSYILKNSLYNCISKNLIDCSADANYETSDVLNVSSAILQEAIGVSATSYFFGDKLIRDGIPVWTTITNDLMKELELQHKTKYTPAKCIKKYSDENDDIATMALDPFKGIIQHMTDLYDLSCLDKCPQKERRQ